MVELPHQRRIWSVLRFFWETICVDRIVSGRIILKTCPLMLMFSKPRFALRLNDVRTGSHRLLLTLSLVSNLSAAPFQNGSFEISAMEQDEDHQLPGSSEIESWTIWGPGTVTRIKGNSGFGGPNPAHGLQHLCLNGGVEGPGMRISQEFDTVAGLSYKVSFRAGLRGTMSGIVGVEARVSDTRSQRTLRCTSEYVGQNGYNRTVSVFFTAESDRSTLTFTDISPDTFNIDLLLDDIQFAEVAAPRIDALIAIELTFNTDRGVPYQLQGCSSIGETWRNVGDPFLGDGKVTSIYRSVADPDLRLYRLLLLSDGGTGDCTEASASRNFTDTQQ